MRAALLFVLTTGAAALESQAVDVQRVIDGDSIIVDAHIGGTPVGAAIRLQWVDTPEMRDANGLEVKQFVQRLLPHGSAVRIVFPKGRVELDGHGRTLGIATTTQGVAVQTQLIRAGYSVYWQKFGAAPEPWHSRFTAAQRYARANEQGLWASSSEWMQAKLNERAHRP